MPRVHSSVEFTFTTYHHHYSRPAILGFFVAIALFLFCLRRRPGSAGRTLGLLSSSLTAYLISGLGALHTARQLSHVLPTIEGTNSDLLRVLTTEVLGVSRAGAWMTSLLLLCALLPALRAGAIETNAPVRWPAFTTALTVLLFLSALSVLLCAAAFEAQPSLMFWPGSSKLDLLVGVAGFSVLASLVVYVVSGRLRHAPMRLRTRGVLIAAFLGLMALHLIAV